jgi:hypothetical protein
MDSPFREAIETAYGAMGEYLETTPHGRAWSLAPMTQPGSELVSLERAKPKKTGARFDDEPNPDRQIIFLTELSKSVDAKKDPSVVKLLSKAAKDSRELLKVAEFRWDEATRFSERRYR